jgi:hypothetical protein
LSLPARHEKSQLRRNLGNIRAAERRFFVDLEIPICERTGLFLVAHRKERIADGVGRNRVSRLLIEPYFALAVVQLLHMKNHGPQSTLREVQYDVRFSI